MEDREWKKTRERIVARGRCREAFGVRRIPALSLVWSEALLRWIDEKRRNTAHSKRFARFGRGFAAARPGCALGRCYPPTPPPPPPPPPGGALTGGGSIVGPPPPKAPPPLHTPTPSSAIPSPSAFPA